MSETVRGFILQAFQQSETNGGKEPALLLTGRLESGETFAVVETRRKPALHIRESELPRAEPVIKAVRADFFRTDFRTMDGEAVVSVGTDSGSRRAYLKRLLHEAGIRTYEADLPPVRRYLMDGGIHCSLSISGPWIRGRNVDRIYTNPETGPAEWNGTLSVLSFDIETDIRAGTVIAVSYSAPGTGNGRTRGVLLLGELPGGNAARDTGDVEYRFLGTERELLTAFLEKVGILDPDIITGWNIADFDLPVLEKRCRSNGVPFLLGRSDQESTFVEPDNERERPYPVIGRQVLDALRLSRMALKGMDDYRLETVARTVTGRTKLITGTTGLERAEEIIRLHREDIYALGEYCLMDADLVLDILEKEKLIDLTVRKSLLIGLTLDQVWKSVVSFEFLYMEELHKRNFVAPTRGVDQAPLSASPGGGIITPQSGLFDNVLVFDFKSLYPSLMRTFNIDPLSHVRAVSACADPDADCIRAPNGAAFDREPGILPALLDGFTKRREQARSEGNATASYAYKIVMNSFYGVLGTEGCRFASSELASAITDFGRTILFTTRDLLVSRGYRVLYGDTDSVFLLPGYPAGISPAHAVRDGARLAREINEEISAWIAGTWHVESKLEIEFEKFYRRFYLPAVRNTAVDEEARGRAKGYAGLLVEEDGSEALDITGMEAVRHDWTDLARDFQKKLLSMVFHDADENEITLYIRDTVRRVRDGGVDEFLIYRKSLRKPVEAYTRSMPPHVRAASMIPVSERMGKIEYYWTVNGPEPVLNRSSPLDYAHYVEKQLKPIAATLLEASGIPARMLFVPDGQLELFPD